MSSRNSKASKKRSAQSEEDPAYAEKRARNNEVGFSHQQQKVNISD